MSKRYKLKRRERFYHAKEIPQVVPGWFAHIFRYHVRAAEEMKPFNKLFFVNLSGKCQILPRVRRQIEERLAEKELDKKLIEQAAADLLELPPYQFNFGFHFPDNELVRVAAEPKLRNPSSANVIDDGEFVRSGVIHPDND